jgi:hypothetical protein
MADTDDSREKRLRELNRVRKLRFYAAHREENQAKARAYYAANREKCIAAVRASQRANLERVRKAETKRRARNPERYAYKTHKAAAKQRNIPFLLTFEDWWDIWQQSGKWEHRGARRGEYCMARFGDIGAYARNNVKICLAADNVREAHLGKSKMRHVRGTISV